MYIKSLQNNIASELTTILFYTAVAVTMAVLGVWIITLAFSILALLYLWPLHINYGSLKLLARSLPKRAILPMLREQRIWRPLANHLLKVAGVPTVIPTHALFALFSDRDSMGLSAPYSPLDYPVFWCQGESRVDDDWYWRRTDKPIAAVRLPNGRWVTEPASS